MINTSQDPDYVGPTGHEKKVHKTHFGVLRTLKKSKDQANWIEVGPGRYILLPKKSVERSREAEEQ